MFLILLKIFSLYAMQSWKIEGSQGKNTYKLEYSCELKDLKNSNEYKFSEAQKFTLNGSQKSGGSQEMTFSKNDKEEWCTMCLKVTFDFIDDAVQSDFKNNQLKNDFIQKAKSLKEQIKNYFGNV